MVNPLVEAVGLLLVLAFLFFVWPPLVLLAAGVALIAQANLRPIEPRKRGGSE